MALTYLQQTAASPRGSERSFPVVGLQKVTLDCNFWRGTLSATMAFCNALSDRAWCPAGLLVEGQQWQAGGVQQPPAQSRCRSNHFSLSDACLQRPVGSIRRLRDLGIRPLSVSYVSSCSLAQSHYLDDCVSLDSIVYCMTITLSSSRINLHSAKIFRMRC